MYSIIAGALMIAVLYFELLDELELTIPAAMSILIMLVALISANVVLPQDHLNRVIRYGTRASLALFLVPLGASLVLAHVASPAKGAIKAAFSYLGRFPAFVGDERAYALFTESALGSEPNISRKIASIAGRTPMEVWSTRTLNCKTEDCLNLSADVAEQMQLDAPKLSESFLTLMHACDINLARDGRVECKSAMMSRSRLIPWIQKLKANGSVAQWLDSADPFKEVLAIQAVRYEPTAEQFARIQVLQNSDSLFVSESAKNAIRLQEQLKAAKFDCKTPDGESVPALCINSHRAIL